MPSTIRRHQPCASTARLWWIALALLFVVGTVLWSFGVAWAAVLSRSEPARVRCRAWLDVGPRGGHVHDTGLSAYGVSDPPRIEFDRS